MLLRDSISLKSSVNSKFSSCKSEIRNDYILKGLDIVNGSQIIILLNCFAKALVIVVTKRNNY